MNLRSPVSPVALYLVAIPLTIAATSATAALFPFVQTGTPQNSFSVTALNALPSTELTKVRWTMLPLDKTIEVDELEVTFHTEPHDITVNTPTRLVWEILDVKTGQAAVLENKVHRTTTHAYAVRNDLRGDLVHIHPTNNANTPEWRDQLIARTSGEWKILLQTAYQGTVYNFLTPFPVSGASEEPKPIDLGRTKELGNWIVHTRVEPDPIRANEPSRFDFFVDAKQDSEPFQVSGKEDGGHNIIFSFENDPYIWNVHGDRSVENLAPEETGIIAQRLSDGIAPYSYIFTFPKPGIWLMHFEIQSRPAHFFLEVNQ